MQEKMFLSESIYPGLVDASLSAIQEAGLDIPEQYKNNPIFWNNFNQIYPDQYVTMMSQGFRNADPPIITTIRKGCLANSISASIKIAEIIEDGSKDALVGTIWNKGALLEFINSLSRRVGNTNLPQVLICFFDVDDFKRVNSTLTHQGGDEVLKNFGELLQKNTRGYDMPARFGGDEFAIVIPITNQGVSNTALFERASALQQILRVTHPAMPKEITTTMAATLLRHNELPDELFARLSTLLLQAKQNPDKNGFASDIAI